MALTSARQILNKKILDGGSSADVQELKVEVAALSASVLTIGEKVDNISEYSITEHVVGKWTDDSDLYEITVLKSNQATGNQAVADLSSLSIKDVISIDGLIADSGNSIPFGFRTDVDTFFAAAYYRSSDKTLRTVLGSSYDNVDVIATMRYTKTVSESKKKTTKKK